MLRTRWFSTILLGASLALSACSGDDDGRDDDSTFVPRDAGETVTPRDGGPDVERDGGDVERDGGPPRDGGTGDTPSALINIVRLAPPGVQNPPLTVEEAIVTYTRDALGDDPAGFFVQVDMTGPALFVAIPTSSVATPAPVVGDEVSFTVNETEVVDAQHRVIAVSAFTVDASGRDVAALVQDLSMATDVVTDLTSYESEIVRANGTLTGAYAFAGNEHRRIGISTQGLPSDNAFVFRVPETLIGPLGLVDGCDVNVGPIPMWRFSTTAQLTIQRDVDVSVTACANGVQVQSARALSATSVEVVFDRPLAAATVMDTRFTLAPNVNVTGVAVNANVVTLTTDTLTELQQYTLTVDSMVTDDLGNSVDANANSAMFTAPSTAAAPGAMGDIIFTEIMQNPAAVSDNEGEYFEVHNTTGASLDLTGCTVTDEGSDTHVINQPVVVPAGGYVALARTSSAGFVSPYIYADINLGNGSDSLVLICGGTEIDRVAWDNGATFPDPSGASMNLDPSALNATSNDDGSNWCESVSAFGTDQGTPNAPNDVCPTAPRDGGVVDSGIPRDGGSPRDAGPARDGGLVDAGTPRDGGPGPVGARLVINEVDYDQINTDAAEFVEIYNAGTAPAVLTNVALVLVNGSNDSEYNRVDLATALTLAPGAFLVVGPTGLAVPGGVTLIEFTGATNNIQNGAPDAVALIDTASNTLIDALSYEGSITAASINGFAAPVSLVEGTATAVADSNSVDGSLVRVPDGADTDDASVDWSLATTPSPGAAN
ncbi:MAG: lamin tail domain-containing protein [Deltaproteobacteria bacterium]